MTYVKFSDMILEKYFTQKNIQPMYRKIIFAIATLFMTTLSSAQALTLTSPHPGIFQTGDTLSISYLGGDPTQPIYLSLIDTVPFMAEVTIAQIPYGNGTYQWVIPPTVNSGHYQVYVENNRGGAGPHHEWMYGEVVTILQVCHPSLQLLSPNGGESYRSGDSITITWSTSCFDTTTVIVQFYLTSDVDTNTALYWGAVTMQNTGSYRTMIPVGIPAASNYKIHLSTFVPFSGGGTFSSSDPHHCVDMSDLPFTIH